MLSRPRCLKCIFSNMLSDINRVTSGKKGAVEFESAELMHIAAEPNYGFRNDVCACLSEAKQWTSAKQIQPGKGEWNQPPTETGYSTPISSHKLRALHTHKHGMTTTHQITSSSVILKDDYKVCLPPVPSTVPTRRVAKRARLKMVFTGKFRKC